jgi:amino acid transporter
MAASDMEKRIDLGATALAAEQEKRLVRTLTRLDTIFLIVAAVIALDIVAQVASYGGETFTWALVIAALFLVPMALIFAETGGAFTQEGGPYQWVKYAFGRGWSAVSTVMYWITNPIWLGGSLAFVAYEAWNGFVFDISSSFAHYAFLLIFIWFAIFLAVISLRTGKHFTAAADGAFFGGYFGEFSKRLHTPVRMNILSGVVSTIFMLAAMQLTEGDAAAIFVTVLIIAITTLLISYLIILPAVMKLKTKYPHVPRPFVVPGGNAGFMALGILALAWIVLGSWVALFPGTLEALFGIDYPFVEIRGLSRTTFEVFTLGTMAIVILIGIAGYIGGARLRQTIGPDPEAPQGALGD